MPQGISAVRSTNSLYLQLCYLEVLTRLRESVRRKSPGIWPDNWIPYRANAHAHDALRVREFLAKNSVTNWTIHLMRLISPLLFLALSKIKECPEGTKICLPF